VENRSPAEPFGFPLLAGERIGSCGLGFEGAERVGHVFPVDGVRNPAERSPVISESGTGPIPETTGYPTGLGREDVETEEGSDGDSNPGHCLESPS